MGVQIAILKLVLPSIFEAGLLLEEATQLAWASWAATTSPVLLKNFFPYFRNASVKFSKTLGKHISLDIGEREEEKEENQVLHVSIRLA